MNRADDLLVEIGTEELPPKALKSLMDAFAAGMGDGLDGARLGHGAIKAFASPRRLAVIVAALDERQPDHAHVQKGPPLAVAFDAKGQPTKAAVAFASRFGVEVSALDREETEAGAWLSYRATERGQAAAELLPAIVQAALDGLPIPRRMRWGAHEHEFVRPVHWLIMLHGRNVIDGSVLGIRASNKSRGHRFHTREDIVIDTPGNYARALEEQGFVVADFAARRQRVVGQVESAAQAAGGEAVASDALYDEVTALTEWPVAITGRFDEAFLALPQEVIVETLTRHQRYFPVVDRGKHLLPLFIAVANLDSPEPLRIRDGNERVIRPRLADAVFFWDTDRAIPFASRVEALKSVVYQQGLGTLHDKSLRVAELGRLLAREVGADEDTVARSALLAKCDLVTGMVGEFPELQGTMGAYYASASGEGEAVGQAIGEQYLPRFSGDELPKSIAGQLLAVADKLDTLAGIFSLGKRPSGNRDPFGLRRAALGMIRIVLEAGLDVDIGQAIGNAVSLQPRREEKPVATSEALFEFVMERLKSHFGESACRFSAEAFEAVRSRRPSSLPDFRERLEAVLQFAELDAAVSLAAANKRTANILRHAQWSGGSEAKHALLVDGAESTLYHAMQAAREDVDPLLRERAYSKALRRLAQLGPAVDAFFDEVMVMTEEEALRQNRLALLAGLRDLFLGVADISRLTPSRE